MTREKSEPIEQLRRVEALAARTHENDSILADSDVFVDVVTQFVKQYQFDDEQGRRLVRGALDVRVFNLLLNFAQHMATLAVRERSLDRLELGLSALALAGSAGVADLRDVGMRTQPLRDAAARLGAGALPLFDEAASLATPEAAALIVNAKPWAGFWGNVGIRLHRQFAQEFWRPTGKGVSFQYGSDHPVSAAEAQQRVAFYKRRMKELGYTYPEDLPE